MKAIKKDNEIEWMQFEECHEGLGTLYCKSLLDECDSTKFNFMHRDEIKAGVSIGVHIHTDSEEIYYLVSGKVSSPMMILNTKCYQAIYLYAISVTLMAF